MLKKYELHCFVCERCSYTDENGNKVEGEGEKIKKLVKEEAHKLWPKEITRVNSSGCLGQCEHGVAAVIYPQTQWLLNLKLATGGVQKMIEALKKTRPPSL